MFYATCGNCKEVTILVAACGVCHIAYCSSCITGEMCNGCNDPVAQKEKARKKAENDRRAKKFSNRVS